jgi:hypothetical protein
LKYILTWIKRFDTLTLMKPNEPVNKFGWPTEKFECLPFETLVNSVLSTLKYAYTFKSRNRKSLPTSGRILAPEGACNGSTEDFFSQEGLEYENERGRDILTVIISDAIRLGMEQGKRYHGKNMPTWDDVKNANESAKFWRKKFREATMTPEQIKAEDLKIAENFQVLLDNILNEKK